MANDYFLWRQLEQRCARSLFSTLDGVPDGCSHPLPAAGNPLPTKQWHWVAIGYYSKQPSIASLLHHNMPHCALSNNGLGLRERTIANGLA